MSLGEDLYREIIIEHSGNGKNRGRLPECTHCHMGHNPLCGDEIELQLIVENGKINDVKFDGEGCSISQASASMLADELIGKSVHEAEKLHTAFLEWMKNRNQDEPALPIGDLEAFAGVRQYPVRIKCALLAWTTLKEALALGQKTAASA